MDLLQPQRGRKAGSMLRSTCGFCSSVFLARGTNSNAVCEPCKAGGKWRKGARYLSFNGKNVARGHVGAAIRQGLIPPASKLKCVDCGSAAADYDHRDYNKPLEIEPVCRSCNLQRGPAIPLDGAIDLALRINRIPYRLKKRAKQLFERIGRPTDVFDGLPAKLTLEHWKAIWPTRSEQGA